MAAVDDQPGEPGLYRDYKLRSIVDSKPVPSGEAAYLTGKASSQ